MRLLVDPVRGPLSHELLIPNSKYHAHRALILASLVPGRSRIIGLTHARHVAFTIKLLRGLGTSIQVEGDSLIVDGGPYQPMYPELSAGSSGTTLYFMIGLCALAERPVTLQAQRYFMRRPIRPLLESLDQLGIGTTSSEWCPPIRVEPGRPRGGSISVPGTLSQWLSGLLLVAPFARTDTTIEVQGALNERPYVDLTVSMMRQFGLEVAVRDDGRRYVIPSNQQPRPATIVLPPDISTAAFGLGIAALHPANILLKGLNGDSRDHPEAAFLDVIRAMGLPMQPEPASHGVRIRHGGFRPRAVRVDCRETPDILPILAALATFAEGETVLDNIEHVRLKESDRVSAMLQLNRIGGRLRIKGSTLTIRGVERLRGGRDLSSFNDHRVLMSLAIAATRADDSTRLTYPHAYRISYPDFLDAMNAIGARMECVA
ncbi:MAG TPA: 3-phosphoshikimate 1-carboxyvinyltransferase [Steroidobacteraceae bacterium]|nr:3-phosphoshikimate 1-carboxyvinyltransferase [Steroidobacteraceae bacterium]